MKIIVLDGYGLDPGDLSWSAWEALGWSGVSSKFGPQNAGKSARESFIPL